VLLGLGVILRVLLDIIALMRRLIVAAVVVPAAVSSIIVVPQNHGIIADIVTAFLCDVTDTMELL
jgi:hypothetical protein